MDKFIGYSKRAKEIMEENKPDYGFHRRKLLRGIIYCTIAYFMFFSSYSQYLEDNQGNAFKHDISAFLQRFLLLPNNAAGVVSGLLVWITVPLAIWSFIAGPYNVLSFGEYNDTYDAPYPILHQFRDLFVRIYNSHWTDYLPNGGDSSRTGQYKGIQRIAEYRDLKMQGRDNEQAKDIWVKTQVIDNILSGNMEGRGGKRTADYIDARVSGMNSEDGLKFIQGDKK